MRRISSRRCLILAVVSESLRSAKLTNTKKVFCAGLMHPGDISGESTQFSKVVPDIDIGRALLTEIFKCSYCLPVTSGLLQGLCIAKAQGIIIRIDIQMVFQDL